MYNFPRLASRFLTETYGKRVEIDACVTISDVLFGDFLFKEKVTRMLAPVAKPFLQTIKN